MKIALIGATGMVGSRVLKEALSRGHQVTALTRDPKKLEARPGVLVASGDAADPARLAEVLQGHDAVVSSLNPGWADPKLRESTLKAYEGVIAAAKGAKARRLLVVGGAGTLDAAPGVFFVDTPAFPPQWKEGASGMRDVYLRLKRETELDWAFFAPPPLLEPGERTGRYSFHGESLPAGRDGAPARISVEDYAAALVDELEKPRHSRTRFTAASAE